MFPGNSLGSHPWLSMATRAPITKGLRLDSKLQFDQFLFFPLYSFIESQASSETGILGQTGQGARGDEAGHCRQKSLCLWWGYGSVRLLCPGDGGLETEADELCRVHCRVWTFTQHLSSESPWKREDTSFSVWSFLKCREKTNGGQWQKERTVVLMPAWSGVLRAKLMPEPGEEV